MSVFISYSHDSKSHSERVLELANRLRRDGVDAQIDQYQLSPPEGWPAWMARHIRKSDFVLVVCSSEYAKKATGEILTGNGVKWESVLAYQELYEAAANTKYIPVLFEDSEPDCIPAPLRPATRYRLPQEFEDVYRRLTNQPRVVAPPVGQVKILDPVPSRQGLSTDPSGSVAVRSEVEIVLDIPFQEFSEDVEERFLASLKLLLNDHDVAIKRKRQGSAVITIDLTPGQYKILRDAMELGLLSEFDPIDLRVDGVSLLPGRRPKPERDTRRILFLSANPSGTTRLQLAEEYREIEAILQKSSLRDHLSLKTAFSVRPQDFSQAMLEAEPHIVHFSGHGSNDGALMFEDNSGRSLPIDGETLAALFENFSDHLRLVVLNACFSDKQAKEISKHVDHVIGMSSAITDEGSIAYTVGLYQALGAGRSVEQAHRLACVQIRLRGSEEYESPKLIRRPNPHIEPDG